MKPIEQLTKPNVTYGMYGKEIGLLILAACLPIASWLIWHSGEMVARSGSLVVFCSVLAEFLLLNKANVKHIRNAQRALKNIEPYNFSNVATVITYSSLVIALIGTFIWGYGDLFIAT